jgi:polyhydroxybutyrate depolymerase
LALLVAACSSSSPAAAPAPSATTTLPEGACTPARPKPTPEATNTLQGREYSMTVPDDYDGVKPYPMIVVFHGWASERKQFEAETGLDRAGSERGYIVVTPQGAGNPATWNFIPGASGSEADDFAFVDALVNDVEQRLCVDTHRVYATGHSAGSAFVGFLVCKAPYRFAGAAMVSATIPSSCPDNVTPAILGIHGKKDPGVLYDGGAGAGQSVPIPPIRETIARHAARSQCAADPTVDTPAAGVEALTYTDCKKGAAVGLITILEGGHPWPGGSQVMNDPKRPEGADFSATNAILDFFDDQAR